MISFKHLAQQALKANRVEAIPTMRDMRLAYAMFVFTRCRNRKATAARALGVDTKTLAKYLKEARELLPLRSVTEVVLDLNKAMPVKNGAVFDIGPETAAEWGVEPGRYRWDSKKKEAVAVDGDQK